jgi:hypothetical protein
MTEPPAPIFEVETALEGRLAIVQVTIDGKQYPFIVDTGASHVVFCTSLRHLLPDEPISTEKAWTAGGAAEFELFTAIPVSLGPIAIPQDDNIVCLDLEMARQASGKDVRGMLGINVFQDYVLQLDFDNGILRLFDRLPGVPDALGYRIPLTRNRLGYRIARFSVALDLQADFVIDTGDLSTGCLKAGLYDALLKNDQLTDHESNMGVTAAGRRTFRDGYLDMLVAGPFAHRNLRVDRGHTTRVGLMYLARYFVTLDLPNNFMYLKKGKRYDEPDRDGLSGIEMMRRAEGVVVATLKPHKAGAKAGVKVGDIITHIDGKDAADCEFFHLYCDVFTQPGRKVELTLRRGEETHQITMHLPDVADPTTQPVGKDKKKSFGISIQEMYSK